MTKESIILLFSWVITFILLVIFTPKHKIREAFVIFFFKQFMTWVLGLFIVEMRLIEYPIRVLFPYATRTSFTFEYFIYPSVCVLFNLHYPNEKSKIRQFLHYIYFCSVITIIEVVLEETTKLIIYTNWNWYWTFITLFATFYFSRKFYLWFFKNSTVHNI